MPANDEESGKHGGNDPQRGQGLSRSEPGSSSWPNWSIFTGVAKAKMVAVEHSKDVTLGDGAGIAEFTLWGTGQEPHEPDYLAMAT